MKKTRINLIDNLIKQKEHVLNILNPDEKIMIRKINQDLKELNKLKKTYEEK